MAAEASSHQQQLLNLCRICGEKLAKDPVLISKHATRINEAFFLSIEEDNEKIHPPKMCKSCYTTHNEEH